jgi:hypothetical protein
LGVGLRWTSTRTARARQNRYLANESCRSHLSPISRRTQTAVQCDRFTRWAVCEVRCNAAAKLDLESYFSRDKVSVALQ